MEILLTNIDDMIFNEELERVIFDNDIMTIRKIMK